MLKLSLPGCVRCATSRVGHDVIVLLSELFRG